MLIDLIPHLIVGKTDLLMYESVFLKLIAGASVNNIKAFQSHFSRHFGLPVLPIVDSGDRVSKDCEIRVISEH